MSEAIAQVRSNPWRMFRQSLKWLALFGIVVALASHADGLVDRVPALYAIVIGLLGFGGGIYAAVRLQTRFETQGWRGYLATFVLPFMMLIIFARLGRLAFEAIAFSGVPPSGVTIAAPIIDMSSRKLGTHASIKIDPSSREIRVSVTQDLYERMDAYRFPGRDCLTLIVQTGRFGIRRAVVPAPFDQGIGVEKLRPCPADVTTWAVAKNAD